MIVDFYPLQRRWRKVGPIYRSDMARAIWLPEMKAYQRQRMSDYGVTYAYPEETPDLRPSDWESSDWRYTCGRRGPEPAYWQYLTHGSCHWMCNLHLWVAVRAESDRPWRIVTSGKHSTVWDGDQTLWDPQFMALGVSATDAWDLAAEQPDSEMLPPGELMLHT